MGTIPEAVWGASSKPGLTSQTGCVWHLIEGHHEPVDVVYFWGGTSLCAKHLPSHAKQYPLQSVQPSGSND
jgi:hypothetical protein